MVKKLCAAVAFAVVAGIMPAAAQEKVTGWIALVDRDKDTVIMDDGRLFKVSPDIGVDALKAGVRVTITYKDTPSGRTITAVLPAAPPGRAKHRGNV